MENRIEFVVATAGQEDLNITKLMNLQFSTVITSQCGKCQILREEML